MDDKDNNYTLNANTMAALWEKMKEIHDSPSVNDEQRNKCWDAFDKLVGEYNAQSAEEQN